MYKLPDQPLGIGRILDNSLQLFKSGFAQAFPLAALAALASSGPELLGLAPALIPGEPGPPSTSAAYVVATVLFLLVSVWLLNAVIHRLGGVAAGRQVAVGTALGHGLRRLPAVILAWILYLIAVLVGLVLLLVPGLIVMVTLAFFLPAIVLDGDGPWDGIKHSHQLAWGNWWRIMIIYLVPGVIAVILMFVVFFMFGLGLSAEDFVVSYENLIRGSVAFHLVNAVANGLVMPLFYAVMIVIYHDLKLRKGGADIEARLNT